MTYRLPYFDFNQKLIQEGDSVLIIHEDPNRAAILMNRILKLYKYEFGNILVPQMDYGYRFRMKKQVSLFNKKLYPLLMKEIYGRQGFHFPPKCTTDELGQPVITQTLEFLPRSLVKASPILGQLSETSLQEVNKFIATPYSFLVLHHCFDKNFPNKNDLLSKMLPYRNHRLLILISGGVDMKFSKDNPKPCWVFFFAREKSHMRSDSEQETYLKRWFQSLFSMYFWTFEYFKAFLNQLSPTQGLALFTQAPLTHVANEERPILDHALFLVKQLRKRKITKPISNSIPDFLTS